MHDLLPAPAISPLRQRLIEEMNLRRFSHETQRNYLRDVGRLATFLGRRLDTASAQELRRFQVEQRQAGVSVPTLNGTVSALRFFFTHALDRPDLARRLVRLAYPRTLPVVLSHAEVARLLAATTCLKHQAALAVAYGAGLRVAEVAALKVTDIDSQRMLIRVEQGKGGRYRNALLSADLLALLRQWWRTGRRHRQAGRPAHPAPQLRYPPPGGRHRYPGDPGPARPRQARQHRLLHQGRHPDGAHRDQPPRSARPVRGRGERGRQLTRRADPRAGGRRRLPRRRAGLSGGPG